MKKTIVLVDDDGIARQRWAKALREEGYEVVEAGSPEEARKLFKGGEGDLAVIDLHLERENDVHDQSGRVLAAEALELAVPALLFTGKPQDVVQPPDQPKVPVVDKSEGPPGLIRELKKVEDELRELTDQFVPVVFLSHGHDKDARKAVEDFLRNGRMHPLVLQEQVGVEDSILEKFERCTRNAHFAIILITPDDVGCEWKSGITAENLQRRARQNVIFEWGFLMAKLGRSRVLALSKGAGIELPSNYGGFRFIEMDADGEWRGKISREMRRALIRSRDD